MNEIAPKAQVKIPKQLVVFKFNSWIFYNLGLIDFLPTKSSGRYAILPFSAFGVVDQFETDPANIMMMGKTGDYLFLDPQGTLTIVDKAIGPYYV
jgi:hypothetical protein